MEGSVLVMQKMVKALVILFAFSISNISYAENLYIFTASWCRPCQTLKKFMTEHPEEFIDYDVSTIDIDKFPEFRKKYSVKSVPTTILLIDGVERDRLVGYSSSSAYKNWLKKWINKK